ncbi:MAG: polyhydroxyalkanoic acid system family protein [Phycisphaerales bacterium]|nr:polyhydroxyalkanoic acid system family protein [Hyphomonadaceae bacterium]
MGRPVTVSIPHQLGREEARKRVDASLDQFKAQLGSAGLGNIQHAWTQDRLGFTAKALGQNIMGRIDVNDTDLKIEVELPGLLGGLAEKIAGRLKQQGTLLIEKK